MKKLLLIAVLSLVSLSSHAILLTDLLAGQSITAGDKIFDQWELFIDDSSDGTQVNTDNIDVTALDDGGLNPGPGLSFSILNNEFLVEGDGIYAYLDFMFGFRATVLDPSLSIKDNSLDLTDATITNGLSLSSIFIEENIYADSFDGTWLGIKDVEFSSVFGDLTSNLSDSAAFAPQSSIYVTKNILIEALDQDEFANLIGFEQRFSQVPEPGVLALLGLGMFGLRLSRRRK